MTTREPQDGWARDIEHQGRRKGAKREKRSPNCVDDAPARRARRPKKTRSFKVKKERALT